jgi:hypothetical protein
MCFGKSTLIGQITHTRRSDGAPESNGVLQIVTSDKKHHRQNYLNQPDPTVFMPVVVDTRQVKIKPLLLLTC